MSCRDIHATNAFSFIVALVAVGGMGVATVIPQWRVTRLVTFNRNAKNVSVYDGLWAKCVKQDGYSGCYYYDSEWYSKVDQLDLRLLQFCLPTAVLFGVAALLLCMSGMCKTCCCSDGPEPDIKTASCLVNSAGCHLVAATFLFLGGAIGSAPSIWFLFRTKELNARYGPIFSDGFAPYVAIGCSGGLVVAALLMFMWYCMCKKLPSPFWLPLPSSPSAHNGYPPSSPTGGYGPPQPFMPTVVEAQPQAGAPGGCYAQSVVMAAAGPAPMPPQVYMSQMSVPDGYGSETGGTQVYSYDPSQGYAQTYAPSQSYAQSYAPSQGYAPSQQGYAPSQQGYASSYVGAGQRYSTRSRMSAIEIDIPVLTQQH